MPTFLFMRKGATLDTLKGANSSKLTSLVQQYSKTGTGMGGFPGGGQTIGGRSVGTTANSGGLLGLIQQIPKENMLPFVVILGYLAYVIFGRK